MDIITLGELLIDMIPAQVGKGLGEVESFQPTPGGAPANVAIAARRLGARTGFIGKVGDDPFGYHLRDVLRKEGVETIGMRFDPDHRTTLAFVALPDENHPEFSFYRDADTRLTADELDVELLRGCRAFHFGSLSLTGEPIRSAALAAVQEAESVGALISFDANYRPALWPSADEACTRIRTILPFVNVLKVNEVELELLTGTTDLASGSRALLDHGPEVVLITLGENGSYFRSEMGGGHVRAFRTQVVDAVGSGDGFTAGVLARLVDDNLHWRDRLTPEYLHEALRYGNAVGALTAQRAGVIPALPSGRKVEEFLIKQMLGG